MFRRVCATGHIKDPVLKKSRALCPSGRFLPSFIHQGIIITVRGRPSFSSFTRAYRPYAGGEGGGGRT